MVSKKCEWSKCTFQHKHRETRLVAALAPHPKEPIVAIHLLHSIEFVDVHANKCIKKWAFTDYGVPSVSRAVMSWNPPGTLLAVGSENMLSIWNYNRALLYHMFDSNMSRISNPWDPTGAFMLTACNEQFKQWTVSKIVWSETYPCVTPVKHHSRLWRRARVATGHATCAPNRPHFVCTSQSSHQTDKNRADIHVYHMFEGTLITSLKNAHHGSNHKMVWSPCGRYIAEIFGKMFINVRAASTLEK